MCFDEWNVNKQFLSVLMLFTNLRVDPNPRGRCPRRQSRQTLSVMRRVNTVAKYMYRPSREFVCFNKKIFFVFFRQCRPGVLLLNAEKHFLKCTNSRLGRTCTLHVCLLYALQAKSASIDVTKGVGGVSPPNKFIYFFNM